MPDTIGTTATSTRAGVAPVGASPPPPGTTPTQSQTPPPPIGAPVVAEPIGPPPAVRAVPSSLVLTAIGIILVGAWGGIVPYVGPLFGFSGNGGPAWQWTESHALLSLLPGAVAVVAGLVILGAAAPRTGEGKARFSLSFLGTLTAACGGWFAVGSFAWLVLRPGAGAYFATSPAYTTLMHELGYAVGPGLVLALFGGIVLGWAVRHQRPIAIR